VRRKLEQQQGLLDEPAELEESDFLESIARTIFRKGGGLLGELLNPKETGLDEGYLDDQGRLVVTEPLVRERNFRNWFGDSKVVDEEGKPQKLYRGERSRRTMEPGRGRATLSFTTDPEVANVYSRNIKNSFLYGNPYGAKSNVLPVNLSMQNPLDIRNLNEYPDLEDVYTTLNRDGSVSLLDMADLTDDLIEMSEKLGGKTQREFGVREVSTFPEYLTKLGVKYNKAIAEGNEFKANEILEDALTELSLIHTDAYLLGDSNEFVDLAKKQGYDGLIHKDVFDGGMRLYEGDPKAIEEGFNADHIIDTFRPFTVPQIKSIHNRGTYNPDDPDLLGMNTMNMSLLYG